MISWLWSSCHGSQDFIQPLELKEMSMKKLFIVTLFLISVHVLVSCSNNDDAKQKDATTPQKTTIKIGVVLPLTGDGAAYGKKEKNGIELAIQETNQALRDRNLEIIPVYEDSQGVPAPAVAAFTKLIDIDKVVALIGGAFSSSTLAMVPIADKKKIVVLSPSASSPKLSGSSKFFFRVWPSDTAEGAVMAEVAIARLQLKKIAILYGNNDYGLGLKDVFAQKIKEQGGQIATIESYNEGDSDFRSQLTKIKSMDVDAIYMPGYYKEFAKILKQAKELGVDAQFMSCGTFHEPEILQIAGNAAEGVVFVQPYFDRNSEAPVTKNFVASYEKQFGLEAGVYAAHGYDAAKILGEVIIDGNQDSPSIQIALLGIRDFPGVTGKTTFIEGGDVVKTYRVMKVHNNKFKGFDNG